MPKIGDRKTIGEGTYGLLKQNMTKAEATRSANWQRKGGSYVRLIQVGRGDWQMWVRLDKKMR